MIYVLNALHETTTFLLIAVSITLLINYIFIKDFRKLVNKIKRVIFSTRKSGKITQIKNLIYNYFF